MSTPVNAKLSGTNLWIALLKGVMLIVFGIWILRSPSESIVKLSIVFGILIMISGLLEVWVAFKNKQNKLSWEWTLTSGILDVVLGAFLVANPEIILLLITFFVSIWLLIRGILLIRLAVIVKKEVGKGYIFNMVFGIILIVIALIFIWHPEILGITIAFWTALAFIFLGIFRIVLAFHYHSERN
jgi:uncharacterized membrane protein HdeD (DUF308 family)